MPTKRALAALAALVFSALAPAPPAAAASHGARPNIVLIVVDALRADHLGVYGYPKPTSPSLDRWARGAVVFERAFSQSNWTLPALSSLMTGLYPSVHGATAFVEGDEWPGQLERGLYHPPAGRRLDATRPTLAAALRRAGYRTAGVVSGGLCRSAFGFGQGFESYYDGGEPLSLLRAKVLEQLARGGGRPFFLYVHVGDVHDPWGRFAKTARAWVPDYDGPVSQDLFRAIRQGKHKPDARERARLTALYDSGVAETDAQLAPVLDALDAPPLAGKTVVVVTADHGDALLEHGLVGHGILPYDELLRVPLIVRGPGIEPGRFGGVVQHVDVLPTLLELAGAPALRPAQGRSLAAALRGRALPEAPAFSEPAGREDALGTVTERTARWKYVRRADGREELYDVSIDSAETRDASGREPSVLAGMRERADAFVRRNREAAARLPAPGAEAPAIDEELRSKLRAEGYVR